jgi:hypothetical protein
MGDPARGLKGHGNGETPEVGGYVKNQWEQLGTVTAVNAAQDGLERINIRRDDGFDLPLGFCWRFYATFPEERSSLEHQLCLMRLPRIVLTKQNWFSI